MNRKNRAKSSSLFLLELILAILFFSIASAVCVQIFVKSHVMSNEAQALNFAISECSGAAEVITASADADDAMALLQKAYADGAFREPDGGQALPVFCVYYDEALQPCVGKKASYKMTVRLDRKDAMLSAAIEMTALEEKKQTEENRIYGLDIVHHLQRGVEHAQ